MQRAALTPGTRLGELEIKRVLADGGFGIVYVARDLSLDRDVAVKEYMPAHLAGRGRGVQVTVQSSANADFEVGLRAFIAEAKLLASFSHPAIVKVYRFWEANGTGYMVMPLLHGPTLSDVRRSMSEPPTEAWMRSMIEPLLDALALLHSRGVCHRDVAPDNVVVTSPGQPVLLDFGAARRLIGDPLRPVTSVVKPSYAPIEQYADTAHMQQGPWTDLYGLAALVAYLIDGKPPLPATTRCVHDDMVPLSKRKIAGVSGRFLAAMDWAFAVRPHDRPHSVAALRVALDGRQSVRAARMRHGATWAWRRAMWAASSAVGSAKGWIAGGKRGRTSASSHWVPLTLAAALLVLVAGGRATLEIIAPRHEAVQTSSAAVVPALPAAQSTTPIAEALPPTGAGIPATDRAPAAKPAPSTEIEEFIESEPRPVAAATTEPNLHVARAAARKGPHRATVRKPEIEVVSAGPREMCAARNFFMRPYCMVRLCTETRFKGTAECSAAPSQARNEHY